MGNLILKNVRIPGQEVARDIFIEDGRISAAGKMDSSAKVYDGQGKLCTPAMVDPHVHLDIALMNDMRKPGRPKPYVSVSELNPILEAGRRAFTYDDIVERALRAIEMAISHGTLAMQAQCHVDVEIGLKHVRALLQVRDQVKDRFDLKLVAFPQQGLLSKPGSIEIVREALAAGVEVMGTSANLENKGISYQEHLAKAFDLAQEFDIDLDVHSDLSIPELLEFEDMEIVFTARETIKRGYQGRVNAGHLCGLDSNTPETAAKVIALIKEAGIGVVSQPDMYRLGREDAMHKRRGLTRVKELLAAGVNVSFASNNVRDAMRPVGNLNLIEEALILSYGAHMDSIEQLETLLTMCTYNAAAMLKLKDYGLEPGCKANLVVLDAYSPSDAIVSQSDPVLVVRNGNILFER